MPKEVLGGGYIFGCLLANVGDSILQHLHVLCTSLLKFVTFCFHQRYFRDDFLNPTLQPGLKLA